MSSHEQEIYHTTSLDGNCIEFEIQTDRNYYVDLRQTYLALKLKLVRVRGYETYNFKISENKGVLHCEGYDYEEFPDAIMEAPLSELFFTRRMKTLSGPDGFMLYGKRVVDFFSTSELLYHNMEIRLRLIRARPNFYMISDNPNVSLGIVDCSLYTRFTALKDDYHKKRIDMLA